MASIFWVEDQFHWINKILPILQAHQFDDSPTIVDCHKSAQAACQKIKIMTDDQRPSLALLDANMHGNDHAGFSVSRALKDKWPDLPIVYFSEHSGTDIEMQALEQGDSRDFIAKHQNNIEQVLCWRIKAVIRQHQLAGSTNNKSTSQKNDDFIINGDLKMDLATWQVYFRNQTLMNPANTKRPLAPTPRKILRELLQSSPRPISTIDMAQRIDADVEKFSYASYRQHIKILRHSIELIAQSTDPKFSFLELCKQGKGIAAVGDEGAYRWKSID
ncbi:response regulator transcription factor [Marinicellulosiphila megalodicopiae]|uniref:response regulator transcription factor n=1 Tax=Marinicellulosiphila megalodicopiae TaxID=2724896 RepID=UPI003BB0A7E7